MIPDVLINFAVGGVRDVDRAFATLDTRLARFERDSQRGAERSSVARVRAAETEAQKRERAYKKLVNEMEREEKRATRDAETQAKAREKAAARSASLATREAKKLADAEIKEAERAAKETERLEAYKMRVRIRSSEMAGRAAQRAADAEISARKRFLSSVGGAGARSIGSIASYGMGALSIGGGFALADAARGQLAAQRQAALLVNMVTTGKSPPAGASVARILGQASQVSTETGMSKDALVGASLRYAQNARGGDFAGAMGNMGFLAKMSKITGADIGELAEAAGTLQSQNQGLNAKGMQQMLLAAYGQSKQGSMSIVDAAKQFGTLGSTRAYYTGDVAANQRTLLGLGQIARSAGDAGEAGTFIKDIATEAGSANRKYLKATGRNLIHFDAQTGQMDSPEKVIEQVLRGTHGNIQQIGELFGQRGSRLFGELATSYQTASKAAGGGQAGVDAGVNAALQQVRNVTSATMTPEDVESQFAQTMSTSAERLSMAFTKLEDQIGDRLEPVLSKIADHAPELADKFAKVIDAASAFAEWFLENPMRNLGLVIAGKVTADITAAAIGEAIKTRLLELLRGAAPPTPSGAGVGVGAFVAGAAVVAYENTKETLAGGFEGEDAGKNKVARLLSGIHEGTITAADVQKEIAKANETTSPRNLAKNVLIDAVGPIETATGGRIKLGEGQVASTARLQEAIEIKRNADLLNQALRETAAHVKSMGGAANDAARQLPINERTRTGS